MKPSPISMMPEGLLDTLDRDEVLDLVAYLLSRGDRNDPMFKRPPRRPGVGPDCRTDTGDSGRPSLSRRAESSPGIGRSLAPSGMTTRDRPC